MDESELVHRVRAAYDAYNRGDVDAVLDLLHPDVDWRPPPNSLEPHPLRGRDAVRRYLTPDFFESQRAEPLEVMEEGDRILVEVRVRARGRGSGVELDMIAFHLLVIEDDRAVRFEAHVERRQALAAFHDS
ncbi:MAG: nuclear transport factor 2 family protein [Pseudonocardiaceae bacterium]